MRRLARLSVFQLSATSGDKTVRGGSWHSTAGGWHSAWRKPYPADYHGISIGFRLGSLFYSNRYWIDDPWRYRLPEVYGPYRWVRYYDDVLLIDIYSGEVVDVVHNFFW